MKFFKKIWAWIKKNKCLTILLILSIILVGVFATFVYNILVSSKDEQYFNRLNESLHTEFSESDKTTIDNSLESDLINNIKFEVNGKLVKIFVYYNEEATSSESMKIITSSIEFIPENIKGYYDFEYFLISDDIDSEVFPIIGALHKTSSEISWTNK